MVAAFMKRLARLSLQAPPAAIITIMPFTYNQMKRHPALMTMIHSAEIVEPDAIYTGWSRQLWCRSAHLTNIGYVQTHIDRTSPTRYFLALQNPLCGSWPRCADTIIPVFQP